MPDHLQEPPLSKRKLYYSYARKDSSLHKELARHLAGLRNENLIEDWHHQSIKPGEDWREQTDKRISESDIILLLVSSDFIASNFCYNIELRQAIARHQEGTCKVVPLLLRPVLYKNLPFSHLRPLPMNRKPVVRWECRDDAWVEIADTIRSMIFEMNLAPIDRNTIEEDIPGDSVDCTMILTSTFRSVNQQTIEAIIAHIRKLSKCTDVTIVKIRKGSIVLVFRMPRFAFERLAALYERQELKEILGLNIESLVFGDIREDEPSYEDLSSPFAKGVGYLLEKRGIVLQDPKMIQIYNQLSHLSRSNASVLILGETGVGKDILARAIHDLSVRRDGPFIACNMSAIPASLAESELFGTAMGAYTGSIRAKKGLFEAAHGGTLFLDEIGDVSIKLQSKLLRAIENKDIRRVGELDARPVDFRLICATNKNLATAEGRSVIRQDLFHRLEQLVIQIPPLRERPIEIPIFARAFLERACQAHDRSVMRISEEAMELLVNYPWPGNIREIKNIMTKIAETETEDKVLETWHLPDQFHQ